MIRKLGFLVVMMTVAACGVAENPYERPYYPTYVGGGDPGGGDPGGGGDTQTQGNCGNGRINPGEDCDLALTLTETCLSLGYASGTLRCSASCAYDTNSCQVLESCNNGQLDTLEACEGFELRGETCESQGFTDGTLRCSSACVLDASQCTLCGNNVLETGEVCDGTQLGGKTCATEAGTGWVGELTCQSCSYLSTNNCVEAASRDEQCYDGLACLEQYSCDVTYSSPDGSLAACKLRCSQPGASGCPGGESCFDSGWVELQSGSPISCEVPSDCSQGYGCLPTNQGDLCASSIAWCGTSVDWVSDYSSTETIQGGPTCNQIYGHTMCREPVGANPADVMCVPMQENGDGVCLALCEGDDGDLDCGPGFQCVLPTTNFYYMVQETDGTQVGCSGDATPCDTEAGYDCVSLNSGEFCARPSKVCVPL